MGHATTCSHTSHTRAHLISVLPPRQEVSNGIVHPQTAAEVEQVAVLLVTRRRNIFLRHQRFEQQAHVGNARLAGGCGKNIGTGQERTEAEGCGYLVSNL